MRVDVCIPSIPSRWTLLQRAAASVVEQTRQASELHIVLDVEHAGAAATRTAALAESSADYVAFLDDDDWFLPQHLERLMETAEETDADVVYPWFETNGYDPLYVAGVRAEGRPFDDLSRKWLITMGNFIPITALVRREALMDVGGFQNHSSHNESLNHPTCEDWEAWRRLALNGAKFVHLPERTWFWNHWGGNTGGRPWT